MMIRALYTTSLAAAMLLAAGVAGGDAMAQQKFVTIGTGGQTGVYYAVGASICRLINKNTAEHGLRCTAEATGGSVYNINAIKNGELDFGVAQSDIQSYALNGNKDFEGQPFKNLRSVFSVHAEPFTVVARRDAGVKTFDDLKGKRVNVGNPGSGQRGTMEVVMAEKGWKMSDFALASELKSAEQAQALSDNKVDAIVFTVGHPNGSIQEATTTVDAVIVPVDGPKIDTLVEENRYYSKAVIPGGMYKGTDKDVNSFGVRATFVTREEVDDETVYQLVKAVFDNFDQFKRLHPAFGTLEKSEMVTAGLSAPLHEGAARYFTEHKLMPASDKTEAKPMDAPQSSGAMKN